MRSISEREIERERERETEEERDWKSVIRSRTIAATPPSERVLFCTTHIVKIRDEIFPLFSFARETDAADETSWKWGRAAVA